MAVALKHRTEFIIDVFNQLPKDMQVKLRQESYYIENDDTGRLTCYQLIGGGSISMD